MMMTRAGFVTAFRFCPVHLSSFSTVERRPTSFFHNATHFKRSLISIRQIQTTMSHLQSSPMFTEFTSRIKVITIPILSDNYSYLIVDTLHNVAAAVDPADSAVIRSRARQFGVDITTVLTTHHHWDHAGGNEGMSKALGSDVTFLGWRNDKGTVGRFVTEGDRWEIGVFDTKKDEKLVGGRVLATPCHTRGHVCYVLETEDGGEAKDLAVFTGDTLFVGGCGKFFEGDGDDMYTALSKLGTLDDDVKVFCGHEYTQKNLAFAKTVEPENKDLKEKIGMVEARRREGGYTVPSTIGEEKKWNPFMRVEQSSIAKAVGQDGSNPAKVMSALRNKKDRF